MSTIINIERWWLSVDGPQLVGMDLGVQLGVVVDDLDSHKDGNCVDVTKWCVCPWTMMDIENL